MSRVDAVRIAVDKAAVHGHEVAGSALASDAFFPFPDGPRIALDAGATSIVQPGGSKRDQDVIEAVQKAGATMVFAGRRHFRHELGGVPGLGTTASDRFRPHIPRFGDPLCPLRGTGCALSHR